MRKIGGEPAFPHQKSTVFSVANHMREQHSNGKKRGRNGKYGPFEQEIARQ